jgi:hypothetical protein
MRIMRITLMTALLAIGSLLLTLVPAAPVSAQPMANVTPEVGLPGARFAFMATGFDDEEPIGTWLNAPDGSVMEVAVEELNNSTEDGRADWYWTAPDDAMNGRWQMVAQGVESDVLRVIPFTIQGEAAEPISESPARDGNVTPEVGPAGARFAFAAVGFDSEEAVGVWVNTPAGEVMAIDPEELGGANEDGRADWYWTSPEDAMSGQWQMVAEGLDSGITRVISFTIR